MALGNFYENNTYCYSPNWLYWLVVFVVLEISDIHLNINQSGSDKTGNTNMETFIVFALDTQ